jgi:hypothetical protein
MGLYNPPVFTPPPVRHQLRFGHLRASGKPAFAADHAGGSGSAIDEATRFAHLCAVATDGHHLEVEVDGIRTTGVLHLPESGSSRFAFQPDRPLALSVHGRLTLHYTLDALPFTALCRASQPGGPEGPWMLEAPHLVQGPESHLTPDHVLHSAWRFEPHGDGPLTLVGQVRVEHLSLTGAGLVFDHGEPQLQPGTTVSGELISPHGERFRVLAEIEAVVDEREAAPGSGGEAHAQLHFRSLGTERIRRLAFVLRGV